METFVNKTCKDSLKKKMQGAEGRIGKNLTAENYGLLDYFWMFESY